jgi:hypothetical protein
MVPELERDSVKLNSVMDEVDLCVPGVGKLERLQMLKLFCDIRTVRKPFCRALDDQIAYHAPEFGISDPCFDTTFPDGARVLNRHDSDDTVAVGRS